MMKVLFFVNTVSSTSIPVEVAGKIDEQTDVDVSIASFYDRSLENVDPEIKSLTTNIYTLGGGSRFDIKAYRGLENLMGEYDILHTHDNFIGSMGRTLSIGKDIKVINTEHNDHNYFSHLQNIVNCPTYPLTDKIITNSNSTKNSFQFYERPFLKLTSCETIYNGVDFEKIKSSTDTEQDLPEGIKIVTASTITKQKNHSKLIEAMVDVLDSHPNVNLIIIGDGPLKSRIQNQTKKLDIDDSVSFLGYLDKRSQVYSTIAQCDIFVVPSIYEGFCNAAVEAMGCGLPVVASEITVLQEVVGEGGLFINPEDPNDIAQKLRLLLDSDKHRRDLGKKARDRAISKFPIDRTVKGYVDIYREVL